MKKKILNVNIKQKRKKKRRMRQKVSAVSKRNNRNTSRCLLFHRLFKVIFINQQHIVASSINLVKVFIFVISDK